MEPTACTDPRFLLASRKSAPLTFGEQTSLVANHAVLLPVSDILRQLVDEIHHLDVVRQTKFCAAGSEVAWKAMAIINCDQLTTYNPNPYIRFDIQVFVAFSLHRDVPYLDITLLPIQSDAELYVCHYYQSSTARTVAAVNLSSAVEIPDSRRPLYSELVVSSTEQQISSSVLPATVFHQKNDNGTNMQNDLGILQEYLK